MSAGFGDCCAQDIAKLSGFQLYAFGLQGTKGKVSPLPAMARQYTQADSEAVNEDILIQWDIALPSGIDFLLALLDAHRRALSKVSSVNSPH